jgi:hypothetical protein
MAIILGGTSKLYATGVADVDPSVAPPKFVAKFERLVQAERDHPRRAGNCDLNPTNMIVNRVVHIR